MLFVDSVLGYDNASLGKKFVVLGRNIVPCSLGVKRETSLL
jgi:hypothetical protein